MVSYSSWNGQPMHANRRLITEVLKGELGFAGFVVTDWEAIDKLPGDYEHQVETSINAGIDMVMVPTNFRDFITTMKELVAAGRIPMARIDDAVRRILRQKARFGLWEHPFADRRLTAAIGARRRTGQWPGRRCGRAWWCSRTSAACCRWRRAPASTSRAAGPTTSAPSAAAGPSAGKGKRGRTTAGTTLLEGIAARPAPASTITFSATAPAPTPRAPTSTSPSSARTPTPRGGATAPSPS